MATLKKVVTPVAKITIPKLNESNTFIYENNDLKKKSTNVDDVMEDVVDNGSLHITSNKGDRIAFETNSTPFCCGLIELGELRLGTNKGAVDFAAKVLDSAVRNTKYTLIINTNGIGPSVVFEKALAKCKYWQLVKTFPNPGSRNTLKLWVSKN